MSCTLLRLRILLIVLVAGTAFVMPLRAQQSTPRVVLLGVDAAGWEQLEQSLNTEHAPSLTELAQQGVLGKLTGFPGGQKEQWRTVATGIRPAVHAPSVWWIKRPPNRLSNRPAVSAFRAAAGTPLWERLEQNGYRTGISGWIADAGDYAPVYAAGFYPHGRRLPPGASQAELLEARSAPNWVATTYAEADTGLILPEAFRLKVAPLIQAIEAQPDSTYIAAIPELADIRSRSKEQFLDIKYAMVSAEISAAIAQRLISDRTLDFVAANLWGLDPIFHRSHQLGKPALALQAWRYIDALIGSLISDLSHDDHLFIVSNHSVDQARNHNIFVTDPILLARGPGIHEGLTVEGATIADIAPTVLSLFGIAAGTPGDGRIMQGLFASPRWHELPQLGSRSAIEPRQPGDQLPEHPPEQQRNRHPAPDVDAIERATLKRMRAIGYFRELPAE